MSSISSGTTLTTALVQTADTSGVLQLQTNGTTTAVTIDTSQNVGIGTTSPVASTKLTINGSNDQIYLRTADTNAVVMSIGNSAGNSVYFQSKATGTGTALPFAWYMGGTQSMTLDASGNLGLATSSVTPRDAGATTLELYGPSSGRAAIKFTNSTSGTTGTDGMFLGYDSSLNFNILNNEAGAILFGTSNTERARIDTSGNLLVGTTSSLGKVTIYTASGTGLYFDNAAATGGFVTFRYNSSVCGSITTGGGGTTTYATSSDYRLKEITGPLTGAKDFIMALQPKQGTWKVNGDKFAGFLAHEFADVSPSSVVGEKDAVDEKGNPVYQGIQAGSAEVIANMVSLLQELSAQVTTLQTQVTALKG